MKKLNEWLSINDEVSETSNAIANTISQLAKTNKNRNIGRVESIPFISGHFVYGGSQTIGDIVVEYEIYFCVNERDVDALNTYGVLNCGADNDENRIVIKSYALNDVISQDLVADIAHEVNHLYQYANGFHKNENLYDTTIQVLKNVYAGYCERTIAFLIYSTFRHEIDSFATQFYHMLNSGEGFIKFDEAKHAFQTYNNINNSFKQYESFSVEEIKHGAQMVGLTSKQCRHRIQTGMKRLENKMFNVFRRYRVEQMQDTTTEGIIRRLTYLFGKYNIITEMREPSYELLD